MGTRKIEIIYMAYIGSSHIPINLIYVALVKSCVH